MRTNKQKRGNVRRKKLIIRVSPDAKKLIEYIESIGVTRSTFNLRRSSESRLKLGAMHLIGK